VKDPEGVRRTREVTRELAVTGREERHDARDVCAHFRFGQRPAVDMPDDHDARLRIDQFGRQARRVGSDAGCALAVAEDVVGWNVAAATRDVALAPIGDDECGVGKPSVQRLGLHLAAPAWQCCDSCFEIDRHD